MQCNHRECGEQGMYNVTDLIICQENHTALHYAAQYGHIDAVRVLMEAGGNVLAVDDVC